MNTVVFLDALTLSVVFPTNKFAKFEDTAILLPAQSKLAQYIAINYPGTNTLRISSGVRCKTYRQWRIEGNIFSNLTVPPGLVPDNKAYWEGIIYTFNVDDTGIDKFELTLKELARRKGRGY